VANKTRTPAPPKRPVQAPKRRDTRKSSGLAGPGWVWGLVGGLAIAGIAVGLFLAFRGNDNGSPGKATPDNTSAHQGNLPGLQKGPAPWPPEYASLSFRLQDIGFPVLGNEQLTYHVHQHLDIYVNGKKEAVPQYIGINPGAGWLTQIHTHDPTGVIHVEADKNRGFTLGQVFDVWGVRFTSTCVGSYCNDVKVYRDGKLWPGNPRTIPLQNHEEIAVVVGKAPKKIPKSWPFGKHGL
jgi:hypothetical protein